MDGEYLQEAIRIGDQLLTAAARDSHGLSWKTPDVNPGGEIIWQKTEDIYAGASGIALFLIALYRKTSDKKYLRSAVDAMRWINWYCAQHPTDNYALISGRMGVSVAYLKLYEATSQKVFLTKALHYAKGSLSFLDAPHVNDLINGISGTLLGLLHLYAVSHEPWVLGYIQKYISQLLRGVCIDKAGLYWDSYHTEIRPLCGFSHGPSGVGFVFLELGRYFNNSAFYQVAGKAFAYEDQYFDETSGNWPDFRLDMYTSDKVDIFEREFRSGNTSIFENAKDMTAWCHGAAGIGMARLRALSLHESGAYEQGVERALAKTKRTSGHSFTLCHGNGGNADLLLEYSLQFGDQAARRKVTQLAAQAIEQRKSEGVYVSGLPYVAVDEPEDLSLFNGAAGIGYFMLRTADPEATVSLLAPRLHATARKDLPQLTDSVANIQRVLLAMQLPRTLHEIEQYSPQAVRQYFEAVTHISTDITPFTTFVSEIALSLSSDERQRVSDALVLDAARTELQQRLKSSGKLYIAERVNQETANNLLAKSDTALLQQYFCLSPEVKLVTLHNAALILKRTPTQVEENNINPFCYQVISQFTNPSTVVGALKAVEAVYQPKIPEQRQLLKDKAIVQVRELVAYGALVSATEKKTI